MKIWKKIVAAALAASMCVTAFAACDEREEKKDYSNMTVLNIGVYDGGLGTEWMKQVAARFEARYEGVSLESGKTGVHVEITGKKDQYLQDNLLAGIQGGSEANELYYTSQNNLSFYTSAGVAYDLTDVVTEKVYNAEGYLAEDGEEAVMSIYDKMDPYFQEAFNSAETEGQYEFLGMPFEDNVSGFVYDRDLFEANDWLDYDGRDGMPATTNEFLSLLQRIARANYIPFTLSRDVAYYSTAYVNAFAAQYEGEANWSLLNSYEGDYTAKDGTKTPITEETGYQLASLMEGKLKAAEFVRDVMRADFYDPDIFKTGHSYSMAQKNFVMSKEGGAKRIAMLFEGEWWENEARGYFNSMGNSKPENGYGMRDFRFYPIPAISGQAVEGQISLGSMASGTVLLANKKVIEGNAVKEKLVKEWLQFQHSEEALEIFSMVTGAVLPYEYDFSEEQLAKMTPFARDVWDVHRGGEVTIIRFSPEAATPFARGTTMGIGWRSKVGTTEYTLELFSTMINNPSLSAQDYFDGIAAYYNEKDWTAAYNVFYNIA